MKNWYSLATDGAVAELDIYGDIESGGKNSEATSAVSLAKKLDKLGDAVNVIAVHINSYGGEVAEGLAIYNALMRHPARVVTTVDGMACSVASVIFMAGDERIMCDASLLMVHNAWTLAEGNASELRKQATDLETINDATKKAYLSRVSMSESALTELMDAETWLDPEEAVRLGFATAIEEHDGHAAASQRARMALAEGFLARAVALESTEDDKEEDVPMPETDTESESETETEGEPDTTGTDDEEDDKESLQKSEVTVKEPEPDGEGEEGDGDSDEDDDGSAPQAQAVLRFFQTIAISSKE